AEGDGHAGRLADVHAVRHQPGATCADGHPLGVRTGRYGDDHALANGAIAHLRANLQDCPGALVADNVRPTGHRTAGAVQHVTAFDADCLDADHNPARWTHRVRRLFVAKYIRPTGFVVHRCLHVVWPSSA